MAGRGGKRRDPAGEESWRRTIRKRQRSGLSVRDFCRREGLKDWTLRWWRQELIRRDQEPSDNTRAEPTGASLAFLPVQVVDPEGVPPRPAPAIETLLPAGPTMRVHHGFDPRTLGDVLAVLEARPC